MKPKNEENLCSKMSIDDPNCLESKTKLKTTTRYSNFSLTSQEICEIIKQCGLSGVTLFNYNGLHVSFAGQRVDEKDKNAISPGQVWPDREQESKNIAQDDYNLMEDHLAELQLVNPSKYEELLFQEEIR